MTTEALRAHLKVCMFDQYGTLVDMQKGLTEVVTPWAFDLLIDRPVRKECATTTSVTELDRENRQLVLSERHSLVAGGRQHARDYRFVMRCWTRGELQSGLTKSGFSSIDYFGAYDHTVEIGATDRLVAVAQRSKAVHELSAGSGIELKPPRAAGLESRN